MRSLNYCVVTVEHRVLLITNDFPPRDGGIESYLRDFCALIEPANLTVLTSTRVARQLNTAYDGSVPFCIHRLRDRVLLPLPHVAKAAARIIREENIQTVWFGAAAPLGLLGQACRRAGVRRIVATTHGHEVGWSMLPGARQMLRQIGKYSDIVTYISAYTRGRFAAAFGPDVAFERLPSGVDIERFSPNQAAGLEIRARHGFDSSTPVIVCISRLVSRKGQDSLIRALPAVLNRVPDAKLLIVGSGPRRQALEALAGRVGVSTSVVFAGAVDYEDLPGYYNAASVFAMPARTRGWGLDVEGLGIVYLEAQACGVPVIAGTSGGAPETVIDGETGFVVNGRNISQLADALVRLLSDSELAERMGRAGRNHVCSRWTWDVMGARLFKILRIGN